MHPAWKDATADGILIVMRNRRVFVAAVVILLSSVLAVRSVTTSTRSEAISWPFTAFRTTTTLAPTTTTAAPAATGSWSSLREPGVGGWITSIAASPVQGGKVLAAGDMLGVALSTDYGATWQGTTGLPSYEMAEITFHPSNSSIVWAASMSGPMRSTDGGKTWVPQRAGMPAFDSCYTAPIEQILFDPFNSNHLLAFGGSQRDWFTGCTAELGTVWESNNGGANWAKKSAVVPGVGVVAATFLAGSRTNLVVAVKGRGIYRSTDAGATWATANSGLPHLVVSDLVANPSSASTLWATLEAGPAAEVGAVVKSTNGGVSWTVLGGGLPATQNATPEFRSRFRSIAADRTGNVLVTSDNNWSTHKTYRSTNGGTSWSVVLDPGNAPPSAYSETADGTEIAFDPRSDSRIYLANSERIVRSDNTGSTWSELGSKPSALGGFTGNGFSGLVATNISINPSRTSQIALCAMDGGNPLWSNNGGQSWTRPLKSWDGWGGCYDAAFSGPNNAWVLLGQANGFNGIARSTDGGTNWSVVEGAANGLPARWSWTNQAPTAIAGLSPSIVLATVAGGLYRSVDGGVNWVLLDATTAWGDLIVDAANGKTYAFSRLGVHVSVDAGATWALLPGSPALPNGPFDGLNESHLALASNGDVLATRYTARAWRGGDGGVYRLRAGIWTRLWGSTEALDAGFAFGIAVDPANPNKIAVVTNDQPWHERMDSTGVWLSNDGGSTWAKKNTNLPMNRGGAIAFDPANPGRAIVGLNGGGFWTAQL